MRRNITPQKFKVMYDSVKHEATIKPGCGVHAILLSKQNSLSIESSFSEIFEKDIDNLYEKVMGSFKVADVVESDKIQLLIPSNFNRYVQER